MIDGAVIVSERKPRTVTDLGMSSNERELPVLVEAMASDVGWLALATLDGTGWQLVSDSLATERVPISVAGAVAMITSAGRLFGIVSPEEANDPAVWFSVPISAVVVTPEGSQGLIRKRPVRITLDTDELKLRLLEVGRRFSHSFQMGQEAAFCDALRAAR